MSTLVLLIHMVDKDRQQNLDCLRKVRGQMIAQAGREHGDPPPQLERAELRGDLGDEGRCWEGRVNGQDALGKFLGQGRAEVVLERLRWVGLPTSGCAPGMIIPCISRAVAAHGFRTRCPALYVLRSAFPQG